MKAVILLNLGGPSNLKAVRPFLFNLFNDKAIISIPNPFRYFLAKLISKKREPIAQEIYSHIGGKSPILDITEKQAELLEDELNKIGDYKVFIAMRYWHPFSIETAKKVKECNPDEIILLPLYPQFSTTTTGSSFKEWKRVAKKIKLDKPTSYICCYPFDEDFIDSHVKLIENSYKKTKSKKRILFSAHGLPEKIIKNGDPYQWQVEESVKKIVNKLKIKDFEFVTCYQSRVGPLKWIGPSTEDEIERGSEDKVALLIVPIAFVSEHSETLVELDIEYKELADELGVKEYIRVPTLTYDSKFISSLKNIILNSKLEPNKICSSSNKKICPKNFKSCLCND